TEIDTYLQMMRFVGLLHTTQIPFANLVVRWRGEHVLFWDHINKRGLWHRCELETEALEVFMEIVGEPYYQEPAALEEEMFDILFQKCEEYMDVYDTDSMSKMRL
uniref:Uncharacterized protein n=1 Tax=Panagrolaimus sp. ES5 TaxID=591445 RepID=A0AC34GBW0_9BILA